MKETLKGIIFILAAMAVFGFTGVFIRFLNLPSQVIVFFSFLFTGMILFIFFLIKDRKVLFVKKYLLILALMGLFNILNNFFFFQAFINTSISNAVLTHYTAPIFVALLAPFILKEKIEKITTKALFFSVIGVALIAYSGDFSFYAKDFIGIIYGTASGLMYALVIITAKHLSKFISIFSINIYQSFFGAMILLPFVAVTNFSLNFSFMMWFLILFALIFGVLASCLHFAGVSRVKSQHAGILAYTEIMFATFYAFVFFFEIPKIPAIIGGILILYGGYLIIRGEK